MPAQRPPTVAEVNAWRTGEGGTPADQAFFRVVQEARKETAPGAVRAKPGDTDALREAKALDVRGGNGPSLQGLSRPTVGGDIPRVRRDLAMMRGSVQIVDVLNSASIAATRPPTDVGIWLEEQRRRWRNRGLLRLDNDLRVIEVQNLARTEARTLEIVDAMQRTKPTELGKALIVSGLEGALAGVGIGAALAAAVKSLVVGISGGAAGSAAATAAATLGTILGGVVVCVAAAIGLLVGVILQLVAIDNLFRTFNEGVLWNLRKVTPLERYLSLSQIGAIYAQAGKEDGDIARLSEELAGGAWRAEYLHGVGYSRYEPLGWPPEVVAFHACVLKPLESGLPAPPGDPRGETVRRYLAAYLASNVPYDEARGLPWLSMQPTYDGAQFDGGRRLADEIPIRDKSRGEIVQAALEVGARTPADAPIPVEWVTDHLRRVKA